MSLSILYRGPLSSCNYDCHYCPFAKHYESAEELAVDRAALLRFVQWCRTFGEHHDDSLSIFFTPWGEALTRKWYWDAFQQLTRMPHVGKVAAQTNLSCSLHWLDDCDVAKVGLWCTYHPSQASRRRFVKQVQQLVQRTVSHSVGMVGLKEDLDEIEQLRRELPDNVYLWINAYKREADYYTADDIRRLTQVDPQFPINNTRHPSLGKACRCGDSVIAVDGDGAIRRCHFVPHVVGNIYDEKWRESLKPALCPNATCGCHIGYVHMPSLDLYSVYGEGVLERALPLPDQSKTQPWTNGSIASRASV